MRTALYRHFDAAGVLLYVGISANPAKRLKEHMAKAAWAHAVATVEIEWFETVGEAKDGERAAVLTEAPLHNTYLPTTVRGGAVADVATAIGRANLAKALSVRATAVSQAIVRGHFPASWFLVVTAMAAEAGFECPVTAFNFVTPASRLSPRHPAEGVPA